MKNQRSTGSIFAISFVISLAALLIAIMLVLSATMLSPEKLAAASDQPSESDRSMEYYRPTSEETITLLLIQCEKRERLPFAYTLLCFDPEKSKITLTEIPPETEVTIGTRTDTLNGQYEYAGSDNAKLGVSNVLFSPVNRYVRVDRKGAENIIDAFGGLEKQLQTPLKQGDLSLSAGNHLLSGEILYQWMSLPASDSYPSKIMWLRDLLENRLTADLQTRGEYLFTAFLNNSDTDISQFDFVQRKKALRYYLNHPDKCVDIQILSGIWSADRSVFYPDTSKRSPN